MFIWNEVIHADMQTRIQFKSQETVVLASFTPARVKEQKTKKETKLKMEARDNHDNSNIFKFVLGRVCKYTYYSLSYKIQMTNAVAMLAER